MHRIYAKIQKLLLRLKCSFPIALPFNNAEFEALFSLIVKAYDIESSREAKILVLSLILDQINEKSNSVSAIRLVQAIRRDASADMICELGKTMEAVVLEEKNRKNSLNEQTKREVTPSCKGAPPSESISDNQVQEIKKDMVSEVKTSGVC